MQASFRTSEHVKDSDAVLIWPATILQRLHIAVDLAIDDLARIVEAELLNLRIQLQGFPPQVAGIVLLPFFPAAGPHAVVAKDKARVGAVDLLRYQNIFAFNK